MSLMSPHDNLTTPRERISILARDVTTHGPIQSQVDRMRLLQYDVEILGQCSLRSIA